MTQIETKAADAYRPRPPSGQKVLCIAIIRQWWSDGCPDANDLGPQGEAWLEMLCEVADLDYHLILKEAQLWERAS